MPSLATKSRLLYWSLNLAGLLCAVVFVLVRVRGGSLLVINKAEYFNARDLYKHSFVDRFREDHPAFNRVTNKITAYMDRPENPPFAQAPVAIVGTSFSDFRFVRSFPEATASASPCTSPATSTRSTCSPAPTTRPARPRC